MCLALYIASEKALPLIEYPNYPQSVFTLPEWPGMAQRFHISTLKENQEIVRKHFSMPNVVFAGSYEGCSCGFNYGREYPDYEDDKEHLNAARESVGELVTYIRHNEVKSFMLAGSTTNLFRRRPSAQSQLKNSYRPRLSSNKKSYFV